MQLRGPALLLLVACSPGPAADDTASATTSGASSTSSSSTGEPGPTSGADGSAGPGSTSATDTGATVSAGGESSTGAPPTGEGLLFIDGHVVGLGVADFRVVAGEIVAVGELAAAAGEEVVDLAGRWVAPAFIDSHVHLVYAPAAEAFAAQGVAGAVDLAAPLAIFDTPMDPLRVLAAGPMITAVFGYPTQSWGANGYGLECADAAAAVEAVDMLADLGAAVIKLPITSGAQLDDEALAAAAARAHELGLPVVSHALTDDQARRAALAGVDVLAHTPTETLSAATIAMWSDRTVISTLRAFGGSAEAVGNLQALRAAGATILYGTDFGNTSTPGIDGAELTMLQQAGLTPQEILAAGTSAPAARWEEFNKRLGAIAVGRDASFLVLVADPLVDPMTLASSHAVYIRGVQVGF